MRFFGQKRVGLRGLKEEGMAKSSAAGKLARMEGKLEVIRLAEAFDLPPHSSVVQHRTNP
jgi:hypothetical protein